MSLLIRNKLKYIYKLISSPSRQLNPRQFAKHLIPLANNFNYLPRKPQLSRLARDFPLPSPLFPLCPYRKTRHLSSFWVLFLHCFICWDSRSNSCEVIQCNRIASLEMPGTMQRIRNTIFGTLIKSRAELCNNFSDGITKRNSFHQQFHPQSRVYDGQLSSNPHRLPPPGDDTLLEGSHRGADRNTRTGHDHRQPLTNVNRQQ